MQWPLVLAALAIGLASTPHCAVMCAAPCAAVTQGRASGITTFQAGRMIGYMAAGALAASSVTVLGSWIQASPALRPMWTILHLGFLALGIWWLVAARHPTWMRRSSTVVVHIVCRPTRPWRAGLAGLAWVAWPCAALQGALLLSALANSPQGGALVMGSFAVASMPGLIVAPWMWSRWQSLRGAALPPGQIATTGYRVAGAGLIVTSGWALTHLLWERVAAWCVA
jgi:sulfite exporter TauE/SafE